MTSCCRCAWRSMTRRIASFLRQLLSEVLFLCSASSCSMSWASRCRSSMRCLQPLMPASGPPSRLGSLEALSPRCLNRAFNRSVAEGEAELLARRPVSTAPGDRRQLSPAGAELASQSTLCNKGTEAGTTAVRGEGGAPWRSERRSSGVRAVTSGGSRALRPPGPPPRGRGAAGLWPSSEPELLGGTGGRPSSPAPRGVEGAPERRGAASLQGLLPPPGSSPGSCIPLALRQTASSTWPRARCSSASRRDCCLLSSAS